MSDDYVLAEFPRKATRDALDRLLGPRRRPDGGVYLRRERGPEEGTWRLFPEPDLYYWLLDRADLAEDLNNQARARFGGRVPSAHDVRDWVRYVGGTPLNSSPWYGDLTPLNPSPWHGNLQAYVFELGGEPCAFVVELDRDEYVVLDLPTPDALDDIGRVDVHVLPAIGQNNRKPRGRRSFMEVYSPPTYSPGEPLKLGPSGRWVLARDTSWQVIFQLPYPQLF